MFRARYLDLWVENSVKFINYSDVIVTLGTERYFESYVQTLTEMVG